MHFVFTLNVLMLKLSSLDILVHIFSHTIYASRGACVGVSWGGGKDVKMCVMCDVCCSDVFRAYQTFLTFS